MIAQAASREIGSGLAKLSQLLGLRTQSALRLALELRFDAQSVFDAVAAGVGKVPAGMHVFLRVLKLKLREFLDTRQLRRLWRVDTKAMFADGLAKGSVLRQAFAAAPEGTWSQEGQLPVARPAGPAAKKFQ